MNGSWLWDCEIERDFLFRLERERCLSLSFEFERDRPWRRFLEPELPVCSDLLLDFDRSQERDDFLPLPLLSAAPDLSILREAL